MINNAAQGYPPSGYGYGPPSPYVPSGGTPYGNSPYTSDVYRPTGPYQTGYVQGSMAASGASSSVSSAATGIASIFSSITGIIASILNAIVGIFVKIGKGILGLFGIGKKKEEQPPGGPGAAPMPNAPNYPGAPAPVQPGAFPNPPPGTDINQAMEVVKADLQSVQDPATAFRHIDLHAKKVEDHRRNVEESAKHAEILAKEAAILAQRIEQSQGRMHPQELNKTISELETKKSQALESLKRAEEFTKATYDEALYAQLAMNTLLPRFPQVPGLAQDANQSVQKAWSAWTTGIKETQYLFFDKTLPPAPEVFTRAVGTVNAYMNQIDQVLGRIMVRN